MFKGHIFIVSECKDNSFIRNLYHLPTFFSNFAPKNQINHKKQWQKN